MDKKQIGLIATVVTALCCGLPGCFSLCLGATFAIVGVIPNSNIDIAGSSDPKAAIGLGIFMLCGGIVFLVIPIVLAFFTLRKKPAEGPVEVIDGEVLPPAA